MKTIEEFLAWLGSPENGCEMEAQFSRREILEFINSNPPCKHFQVYGQAGWHFTKAGERANFCPGCGKELKEKHHD